MMDAKIVKQQIVQWITEYFKDNATEDSKAIIGISGGKDSSVTAALCVQSLGKERVLGVLMPNGHQPDIDVAYDLCAFLGIPHLCINIENSVEALYHQLNNANLQLNQQAKINTPPRIRMATLYAVSAIYNGRVANTCNLSEDWVGYATKFGDTAGDFSPLSELTVTEVKAVGRELGLPSRFIDKTPIDGLCNKTDEENLGFSYDTLDRYLRLGICENEEIKNKIDRLNQQNLHKLQGIPRFQFSTNTSSFCEV